MPSPTAPSSGDPTTRLPNEILLEIFTRCLPRYPFWWGQWQPNPTTAPMLLCRVCSSWRTLALASPTLWTHLSYRLDVIMPHDRASTPEFWTFALKERDIEFLWWWKTNQGQIPPFLAFEMNKITYADIIQSPTKSSAAFDIVEYIISAQFFRHDTSYWYWIHGLLQAGFPVTFPNLHTVDAVDAHVRIHPFNTLLTILPAQAFLALRRLAIYEITLSDGKALPSHYSSLTHLFLLSSIPLPFWYSLIRAVPHLQWGYFDISPDFTSDGITHDLPPPQCTLLELTTLSLMVSGVLSSYDLIQGLDLPALRTLLIYAPGLKVWQDNSAHYTVCRVLSATPAVTKLALEDVDHPADPVVAVPPNSNPVPPIWAYATELAHLKLDLPFRFRGNSGRDEVLGPFVRHIFSSECVWLDLQNPACPIRAITINYRNRRDPIGDHVMLDVQESAAKVPKVVLEFTSELARDVARSGWEEWGARI